MESFTWGLIFAESKVEYNTSDTEDTNIKMLFHHRHFDQHNFKVDNQALCYQFSIGPILKIVKISQSSRVKALNNGHLGKKEKKKKMSH